MISDKWQDNQNHDGEVGEHMSSLMRTQSSPFWISAWWWMKSFWESNVDDVPDLGVMGVHEHIRPLQEETRIRKHVNKVCSLWALNFDWAVQIFLLFRFALFLENRFVFHLNQHFLISKISFHQICTSFQCTNDRVCFTITWHHLEWLQIWPQDGATCHLLADLCFILTYKWQGRF